MDEVLSQQEDKAQTLGLSSLSPAQGSKFRRKRLGKGDGSGLGRTCGKGEKGQTSRSGHRFRAGFEGGQMPIHRRMPKVGFVSRQRVRGENVFSVIALEKLEKLEAKGEITLDMLRSSGLVSSKNARVKILGGKDNVQRKIVVEAHAVSASAKAAIEKAGGEVKIVS